LCICDRLTLTWLRKIQTEMQLFHQKQLNTPIL